MDLPHLTATEWILVVGFGAIYFVLYKIHESLKDIHSEVMNIESHASSKTSQEDFYSSDLP